MVYAVAAYHDTGLREGRERHHEASGAASCAGIGNLRRWFTEAEVATIRPRRRRITARRRDVRPERSMAVSWPKPIG